MVIDLVLEIPMENMSNTSLQKNFCSRIMGCDFDYYCNKANKNYQVVTNEVIKCSKKKDDLNLLEIRIQY